MRSQPNSDQPRSVDDGVAMQERIDELKDDLASAPADPQQAINDVNCQIRLHRQGEEQSDDKTLLAILAE